MRGNAVPTMVWSSAASSSANITPIVARTLMRVVSSACGMSLSLLGAHRPDETQTQMAQLNQFRFLQARGEPILDGPGLAPERLDALAAFLGDLGVDRAPVGRIIHALHQAVALEVVDEARHGSGRDIEHLRQLAHRQTPFGLVLQAHQDLEATLAEAEPIGPTFHRDVHLLPQDADRGQRLGRGLNLSSTPPQHLPDSWIAEEAVLVGLELAAIVIGPKIEFTHIYLPHYYTPQQKAATPGW